MENSEIGNETHTAETLDELIELLTTYREALDGETPLRNNSGLPEEAVSIKYWDGEEFSSLPDEGKLVL